jgi:transposase
MPKKPIQKASSPSSNGTSQGPPPRRQYTREFKEEAVRMLLDGHSAQSVCERLGLSHTKLLYRWKKEFLGREGSLAGDLEQRVRSLEAELKRVERERDILPLEMSTRWTHILALLLLETTVRTYDGKVVPFDFRVRGIRRS